MYVFLPHFPHFRENVLLQNMPVVVGTNGPLQLVQAKKACLLEDYFHFQNSQIWYGLDTMILLFLEF